MPPLTTVRQEVIEWGRASARTLIALVEGREPEDVRLPPVEFVVLSSTAAARHRPDGALR